MKIEELRNKIDIGDKKIVSLLAKRTSLVLKISKYKKVNNIEAFQPEREEDVLRKVEESAKEYGLDSNFVKIVFENILEFFRKIKD